MRYIDIGQRIIVALWVGGLWAIGFIAVPLLFHSLNNRALAGELAASMFTVINGFGLVCGGLLLLFSALNQPGDWYRTWRVRVIAAMMAVAALILFVVQPQMAAIKARVAASGGELGADFGRWHGISSLLYLLAGVLGLLLVAGGDLRRREP